MNLRHFMSFISAIVFVCTAQAGFLDNIFRNNSEESIDQPQADSQDDEVTQARDYSADAKNYDLLAVIDINPTVQQMKVYVDGRVETYPISSGRESFDIPTNFRKKPSCSFTEPYNKADDPDDYRPQYLSELHRSNTWLHEDANGKLTEGSEMRHSIFFNGGIATHQAGDEAGLNTLGPKAEGDPRRGGSGGCVRMGVESSKILFDYIAAKDANGNYIKNDPRGSEMCQGAAAQTSRCTDSREWPVQKKKGLDAVIRVVDTRSEAQKLAAVEQCKKDENKFNLKKSDCLFGKLVKHQNSNGTPVNPEKLSRDPAKRAAFIDSGLTNLTSTTRSQFNYECNKSIYYEKIKSKCMLVKLNNLKGKVIMDPNQAIYDNNEVRKALKQLTAAQKTRFSNECDAEVMPKATPTAAEPSEELRPASATPTEEKRPRPRPSDLIDKES